MSVPHRKLAVIGARENSLGAAICDVACTAFSIGDIQAFGITDEANELDITNTLHWDRLNNFTDVICTVGVNTPSDIGGSSFGASISAQLAINAMYPILLMEHWVTQWQDKASSTEEHYPTPLNFAVISSNSAHIARSDSTGYCMSKAALSMGVRCMGRTLADSGLFSIWGYEPAWIPNTPMSDEIDKSMNDHWQSQFPRHRVPGARLMEKHDIAVRIINDLVQFSYPLNGVMVRLDAEQ